MKIEKYTINHKTRLIEFLKYLWEGLDEAERIKLFEWRFENNPYQERQFMYVALDDEKIVGFRGNVPHRFTVNDKIINVFIGADAVVHPDYRRCGVFSKLILAFIEDVKSLSSDEWMILALSANPLSAKGNLKQGFQQTKGIKKYCYKISIFNYIKMKFCKKQPNFKGNTIEINKNKMLFEFSNKLPAQEISAFLKSNRQQEKISNVRDVDYFTWRYSHEAEKYTCVCCRKNSMLAGYMIVKQRSGLQSSIEEYFSVAPQILSAMIKMAVAQLNIPVLRTQVLMNREKIMLQKSGLITEPDWLMKLVKKERLPVFVRSINPDPKEKDYIINGMDIREIDNWQLFLADKH